MEHRRRAETDARFVEQAEGPDAGERLRFEIGVGEHGALGRPVVPEVYMMSAGVSFGISTGGWGSPSSATSAS